MNRRRQSGFSVVELMVAAAISLLLLLGVITIFIGSRSSYETTQRLSRIHENGRVALEQIVFDLRAAGFQGCARPNPASLRAEEFAITTLWNPTALLWNYVISAEGFDAGASGWTPNLAAAITLDPAPQPGSDVLVVRAPRRDEPGLELAKSQANAADPLLVAWNDSATVANGDTLMVSDCDGRAFFRVTGLATTADGTQIAHDAGSTGPTTNASDTLLHPFKQGAEVVPMQTTIYYLAPGEVDPERAALWRKVGVSDAEEVADGVERMEVLYGIDSSGADARVDEYRNASAVTNWSQVVSVAVALLVRSPEPYGNDVDARQYDLLGTTVGPLNDRHQRQVFAATVALRNHVFD